MLRRLGRWPLTAAAVAVAVIATVVVFVGQMMIHHNFHVVSPGLVYRSAQMDAAGLTEAIQEHGIRSILNLRGVNADAWYSVETNTSQQLGVAHYDFKLSAGQELTDEEMEQILTTIGNAPKPLLIHCKSGADRTGLVGALYLYSVEGKSAESANHELTVWCGHVPYLFWRDTIAMDRSFWRYVGKHAQRPVANARVSEPLVKQD
jgi:protein tyrosine phosphatase (PTP) superfamily phosphohydrolase (DUF442 family)